MFMDLIGKKMEVYIDDMLIKSLKAKDHLEHLMLTFKLLEKYKMKLIPIKRTFRLSLKKFMGYLVTQKGNEVNPDQIQALITTPSL